MRPSGEHPNYCIVEIGQNPGKSPGDLKRLALTQTPVKNHRLTLTWKTLRVIIIIIIIIIILSLTPMPSTISGRTKRMLLGRRGTNDLQYIEQHIHKETKTMREKYGIDWLQKCLWYHPEKLDNRVSEYVWNIQDHKLHHGCCGKLEGGINSDKTNSSWSKNQKRHFLWSLPLSIRYSNDATQQHTYEIYYRIQIYKITRKHYPSYEHRCY